MKKIAALFLVAVMMLTMAVSVFAEGTEIKSPEAGEEHKVEVARATTGGAVFFVENEDGTYTITAKPDSGRKFIKWDITGEYEIVSGSLETPEIVINAKSDIKAIATFDGTPIDKEPHGDDSPKTGVDITAAVIVMTVAVLGTAYCTKRFVLD